MKWLYSISLLAAMAFAQETPLTREGALWVRTARGTIDVRPSARLRISSYGNVVLRGSNGDQTTFQYTQRVRASSEAEARRMLGSVKTMIRTLPDSTTMIVAPIGTEGVSAELQISAPRSLSGAVLETRLGDIEAYDLDGSLQADTTAGLIRSDRVLGNVIARTGGGEIRLGKVGGSVRCLSGGGSIVIDVAGGGGTCQTAGGEIIVREAGGPLALYTEGGNIQVKKAAASVEAHSAAGIIDVAKAGGEVLADTRGGSIQVGAARGVHCESGAGGIRVKTSASPLHVSTAMGNILAELLSGTLIDNASLMAGAGDVTVLIPSNLALSILARNENGGMPRIVSDFAEARGRLFGVAAPSAPVEGAINGGGPVLRINVAEGTVYLRRQK